MTPPDSGARIAATQADGAICLNPWLHGHSALSPCRCGNKPDSGEREVAEEKQCEGYGKCSVCDEAAVEISYGLAQRILAALERARDGVLNPDVARALESDMRARFPR